MSPSEMVPSEPRWGVTEKNAETFRFFVVLLILVWEIMEKVWRLGFWFQEFHFFESHVDPWALIETESEGRFACLRHIIPSFQTIDAKMLHMCWKNQQNTYINAAQLKSLNHHAPSLHGCSKQLFCPHVSQESSALSRRCGDFWRRHPKETIFNACVGHQLFSKSFEWSTWWG